MIDSNYPAEALSCDPDVQFIPAATKEQEEVLRRQIASGVEPEEAQVMVLTFQPVEAPEVHSV